jgi:hypothetical protein
MREDFLHYVWRLKRFDLTDLHTTESAPLELLDFGEHNRDAGPDFLQARLRLAGTVWAGSVEIHLKSSEWFAHGHQHDPAYDNTILHVVLEEDTPALTAAGRRVPCLELRHRIPPGLIRTYWRLLHNEYWIPCHNQLDQVAEIHRSLWLDRLAAERLEAKTHRIRQQLLDNNRDWEATFYQVLCEGFGLRVNTQAAEMLSRALPLRILRKHRNSRLQLEALLFGVAGLLPALTAASEPYVRELDREYRLLAAKYRLNALPGHTWKYMRLRPANFPTVRLAQLATLLFQTSNLFSKALAATDVRELEHMFELKLSNYWQTHYRFGKTSKRNEKALGKNMIHLLIINIIAPFFFLYGLERDDLRYRDRALSLLEQLPAEKNHVIRAWQRHAMPAGNAMQSQALLQLKKHYCDQRRCLECAIGNQILNRPATENGPFLTANEEAQLYALTRPHSTPHPKNTLNT